MEVVAEGLEVDDQDLDMMTLCLDDVVSVTLEGEDDMPLPSLFEDNCLEDFFS